MEVSVDGFSKILENSFFSELSNISFYMEELNSMSFSYTILTINLIMAFFYGRFLKTDEWLWYF